MLLSSKPDISVLVQFGGFSKLPYEYPDLLHSYYGICAFSLLEEPGLQSLCCELGLSMRASDD
jgi:geranylgeranyl transferase type-1 subunit beta